MFCSSSELMSSIRRLDNGLEGGEVVVSLPLGARNYFFAEAPGPIWSPPSPLFNETFLPGVKRPGHIARLSPPSNARVKNGWSYTSTPPHSLKSCTGKNFYLTLLKIYKNKFLYEPFCPIVPLLCNTAFALRLYLTIRSLGLVTLFTCQFVTSWNATNVTDS
jgi:hypothetical protein